MPAFKEPGFLSAFDRLLERGFRVHVFLLVLLGLMTYLNAINHPFVHDDVVFIQQNSNIQRWDNIGEAFVQPTFAPVVQGLVTSYYRPVLEIIYRLQYSLFGLNPSGFHIFNVLVHILNGILVYAIIRRISGASVVSVVVASIFLVHPVSTEAVACISGISNLACALFMLLAFDGYLRRHDAQGKRRIVWFMYVLVMFACALLTKEQAVMLPLIMIVYDLMCANDRRVRAMFIRWSMVGLLVLGYWKIRSALFGAMTTSIFENPAELQLRLMSLPRLIEMYLGLIFFPSGLHYYRSIDILASNGLSWFLFGGIVLGIGLILRLLNGLRRSMVGFGLSWFVLSLVPVLNIIPLVNEYSFLTAAEHNLYIPIVGILIALCAVGLEVLPRLSDQTRRIVPMGGVVLIVGLMVIAGMQNRFWRNEVALFERASQYEPQLSRVRILLAKAYYREGRFTDALKEYQKAEEILTRYIAKAVSSKAVRFYQGMLKGVYSESAQAYAAIGDFTTSIDRYHQALMLDPADSGLYSNRALSWIAWGNMPRGIQDLYKALELDPSNVYAANNLSICLIQQGELLKAKSILEEIVLKYPNFKEARDNWDRLHRQLGDEN